MDIVEVTSLISSGVGIATLIGVFMAVDQIRINRKQLSLSTISYCLEKFGKLNIYHDTDVATVKAYVDLVSEELFFFQYKYLPKEIAYEWIDGMLDYMPLFDSEGKLLNGDVCLLELAKSHPDLLRNYPRIKHTFTINHHFDVSLIYNHTNESRKLRMEARENLIKTMYIKLTEQYTSFDE